MIFRHDFGRKQRCRNCGLTMAQTRRLRSEFCGMYDCDKKTYEEVELEMLIHIPEELINLGRKFGKCPYCYAITSLDPEDNKPCNKCWSDRNITKIECAAFKDIK